MRQPEHNDRVLTAVIVQALHKAGLNVVKLQETPYNEGKAATLALAMAMRDIRNDKAG